MSTDTPTTYLLTNNQFIHVLNKNNGQLRLVEGPVRLTLESFEEQDGPTYEKIILRDLQYVNIYNPFDQKQGKNMEGVVKQVRGPAYFSLYPGEQITEIKIASSLTKDTGIYIRNIKTGEVRLEVGPKILYLSVEEEVYQKELSEKERRAIKLPPNYSMHRAIRLELQAGEVVQLYDRESSRVEMGPKRVFLQPFERPRIVVLSGQTPKVPGILVKSVITTSPSFLSDMFSVRTKDNALLKLHVRYKQRFNIDPTNLGKLFSVNDFIGYASETLASEIRAEAAKRDFEEFHTNATAIVKAAVFGGETTRLFDNGFEIFAVDIKQVVPEDAEIESKLQEAISNNMDLYVKKLIQTAELQAKKEFIAGKKVIEEERQQLIAKKNENYRLVTVERSRIEAEAQLVREDGQSQVESLVEGKRKELRIKRLNALVEVLNTRDATRYLQIKQLESLEALRKILFLKSSSSIVLPITDGEERGG